MNTVTKKAVSIKIPAASVDFLTWTLRVWGRAGAKLAWLWRGRPRLAAAPRPPRPAGGSWGTAVRSWSNWRRLGLRARGWRWRPRWFRPPPAAAGSRRPAAAAACRLRRSTSRRLNAASERGPTAAPTCLRCGPTSKERKKYNSLPQLQDGLA